MRRIECDRCKEIVSAEDCTVLRALQDGETTWRDVDLCRKCYVETNDFVHNYGPEGVDVKTYNCERCGATLEKETHVSITFDNYGLKDFRTRHLCLPCARLVSIYISTSVPPVGEGHA